MTWRYIAALRDFDFALVPYPYARYVVTYYPAFHEDCDIDSCIFPIEKKIRKIFLSDFDSNWSWINLEIFEIYVWLNVIIRIYTYIRYVYIVDYANVLKCKLRVHLLKVYRDRYVFFLFKRLHKFMSRDTWLMITQMWPIRNRVLDRQSHSDYQSYVSVTLPIRNRSPRSEYPISFKTCGHTRAYFLLLI